MNDALFILADADLSSLFFPTVGILVIIGLLLGAVAVVRKWIVAATTEETPPAGFSLGSLRQLVRDGKMTQEEFDKAKAQIIAATQRATDEKAPEILPAPEPKVRSDDPH